MKLWDKGIKIDQLIEQFTVGNDREIDIHIAKYDVQASVAHAKMLASIGIITSEELQLLEKGLSILAKRQFLVLERKSSNLNLILVMGSVEVTIKYLLS